MVTEDLPPRDTNAPTRDAVTRRTKLWICFGLLGVTGAVLVWGPREKAPVELTFVRYGDNGYTAFLRISNHTASTVLCRGVPVPVHAASETGSYHGVLFFDRTLGVHGSQVVITVLPSNRPSAVSVQCWRQSSKPRQRVEALLREAGINIASPGFVATVALPPRPAALSLGPTNQNTP